MKKIISLLIIMALVSTVFIGCGGSNGNSGTTVSSTSTQPAGETAAAPAEAETSAGGLDGIDTVKIGVLIYDSTDSEVVAFKNYYEGYIAKNFPVEFIYSESIATAEEEIGAIENFINLKCKGIISLSDQDRVASIKLCEDAQVYYAIAAGTLDDAQYEELKGYQYYVGSIGPSLANEELVGYEMAKHYLDAGHKNFLIYAGGYPYVGMHKSRTDGFVKAFEEAGVTYTPGANGAIGTFSGDGFTIDTIDGFPDDAGAFWGTVGQKVGSPNLEVVLTAALGVEFFGTAIAQTNPEIKMGTVASFTDAYAQAFNANPPQVEYLAGKFAASIGPIFAAVFNAATGNIDSVRDNGSAFRLDQGYWYAVGAEQYNSYSNLANSTEAPAYTADDLKQYIKLTNPGTDFAAFKTFVEAYTYDEIQANHAQ